MSTCVYLRERKATCGLWDYLCLPVFTWGKAQLHVNTWTTCVDLCLPVDTFSTCGMISLSYMSAPVVSTNAVTTWECHQIFGECRHKSLKISMKKWWKGGALLVHFWCTFGALLKVHHFGALLVHFQRVLVHFWCTFKSAPKVHQKCTTFFWTF